MRPVVSYDDIAAPEENAPPQPPIPSANQPPTKKRRTSQPKGSQRRTSQHVQHWDDPGNNTDVMNYGEDASGDANGLHPAEEDESRELTHEEIWDDSALIDAWNSATAEYETYHGRNKNWKSEPVKKSPLWYNVPPAEKPVNGQTSDITAAEFSTQEDSTPLNFETFVPTHDPALFPGIPSTQSAVHDSAYHQDYLPTTAGATTSQDEAFSRALSATYWAGYWTAVYHYQRSHISTAAPSMEANHANGDSADDDDEAEEDDDEMTDLVDTQR
ncbi:hypothetical protein BDW22DRAFT_1355625 [Trametopsis cervina]|nr:hypothetical protein BDW22DRAFT_1355625 [Trametopsis cervina]